MKCPFCGQTFSPRGLAIHVGIKHPDDQRPPTKNELRAALRDFMALLPADRWNLLRPETDATLARLRDQP